MKIQERFEDDDDGSWRAMLRGWTAPAAPARLEDSLRNEFRRRRRLDDWRLWAGRAAVVALVFSSALAVHFDRRGREAAQASPIAVVATLDLSGFEPLVRMKLTRPLAVSDTSLEGFEPVLKMTMTRQDGGGRP